MPPYPYSPAQPFMQLPQGNLQPASVGFFTRDRDEKATRPAAQTPARQVRAQIEMMRPLLDRIVVELDDRIPLESEIIIPIHTDRWTGKDGAVESYGRGRVVACGPGKRHPKSGQCQRMEFQAGEGLRAVREGDVIRFSELQYPEHKEGGKRYAIITEGDIVGVEA